MFALGVKNDDSKQGLLGNAPSDWIHVPTPLGAARAHRDYTEMDDSMDLSNW